MAGAAVAKLNLLLLAVLVACGERLAEAADLHREARGDRHGLLASVKVSPRERHWR
jgi:hypothetical protein